MLGYNWDRTALAALVILSVSFAFLLILNIAYWGFLRKKFAMAYRILALLLLNDLLEVSAELLPFLDKSNEQLCMVSLIAKIAFTIASDFWICFITSIIYFSIVHPARKITMGSYIGKRVILTYIPSAIISVLLLLLIELNDDTNNIEQCWRGLYNGSALQYIIYITAYIFPTILSIVIITVFLVLYYRVKSPHSSFNWFLIFPFSSLVFSVYFLVLKVYLLVEAKGVPNGQIIYLLQPLFYGIIFIVLLMRQRREQDRLQSSAVSLDLSLGSSFRKSDS